MATCDPTPSSGMSAVGTPSTRRPCAAAPLRWSSPVNTPGTTASLIAISWPAATASGSPPPTIITFTIMSSVSSAAERCATSRPPVNSTPPCASLNRLCAP
eukprot:919862-Pleurochrysis_carterae.AAC.1